MLVPLFEEYHRAFASSHWDSDDVEWLHDLMTRVAAREAERGTEPVYSPSGLGGCLRNVFLSRHAEELGIPRKVARKIETHYYFENGTWIHLKIQLKLYKLSKMGELELIATEIPVQGKHKDNKGTLDVCFKRDGTVYGVDIKGWNPRDFMLLAKGDVSFKTEIQLANYIILANAGKNDLPKIEKGLILAENKAGPVSGYPAAVAEAEISLEATKAIVRSRLRELRGHEEEGSIPKPQCHSTKEKDFKECAFRQFCEKEVERIERRGNRTSPRGDTTKFKVAVPAKGRTRRSR